MKYSFPSFRIQLFAREPVAGQVKTRLYPAIGADRALALHSEMIRRLSATVYESHLAPLELWVSANPDHPLFQSLPGAIDIFTQAGSDLGAKMDHASNSGLQRGSAVILIGADCPSIDRAYLEQACQQLADGADVVVGPAQDGGYVLLGLSRTTPGLFTDMIWGGPGVLVETVSRLEQWGRQYVLLDTRWDVDRPEDLLRLASLEPPLHY